jgi:hypothetical protein
VEALYSVHCKKRLAVFPSPARMSLTIVSLGLPGSLVSDIPAGDGKTASLFLQCSSPEAIPAAGEGHLAVKSG